MDRTQLLIAALVIGVGWYLYKRYIRKERGGRRIQSPEEWYRETQERIEELDEQLRNEREDAWAGMSDGDKLDESEIFINNAFGIPFLKGCTNEDKLRFGKAHFMIKPSDSGA